MILSLSKTLYRELFCGIFRVSNWATKRIRFVVWLVTEIGSHIHRAISLMILNLTIQWAIDRDLLKVCSETMTVSVWVRENSCL
jgi:hypothetical protein